MFVIEDKQYLYDKYNLSNQNGKKIIKAKKKNKSIKFKKSIKISFFTKNFKYICLFIIFLILIIIIYSIFIITKSSRNSKINYIETLKTPKEIIISKDPEEEYKDSHEYFKMIQEGILYEKDKIYYPTNNPKISIALPVHNGEAFIKEAIISIQNQDFKDIEIIIVDDKSTDNSVNLINEIMKTEPRIRFYQNEENKGILYTKTKAILLAKGKYVMTLDDDDKYLQRDAFTTLYNEAEKYNLDILKFRFIQSTMFSNRDEFNHKAEYESPIIYQPELSNFMFYKASNGYITQNGGTLYNQIFRTEVFHNVIKEIDEKYINIKMNHHDDFLLFFLLTRKAKSLKKISRIFYMIVVTKFLKGPKVEYRRKEKNIDRDNLACRAYLNFIEIIFDKTANNVDDKKIPYSQLERWFMNNECKYNMFVREQGIQLCKKFLESEYIEEKDKDKIKFVLARIEKQ